jgi:hypothetical protein
VEDLNGNFSTLDDAALVNSHIDIRGLGSAVHDDLDAEALAQNLASRTMIRVRMGVDRAEELRRKEASHLQILLHLIDLRIDDHADLLLVAPEDIREATARANLLENDSLIVHDSSSKSED